MPRNHTGNSLGAMLASLVWPLVFGLAATAGFYALIYRGPLQQPLVLRYFAGHPINMIETGLFFVGLAALTLKLLELVGQYGALPGITLGEIPSSRSAGAAADCQAVLAQLSDHARKSYLGRRLSEALESIQERGSAEGLHDDLKYLSDVDAGRAQDSYGLVRIVIWATPMLGFLGTVVGITDALGDLGRELGGSSAGDSGTALNTAMQGLLAGLYVAFDTTAIALCFSIILMFIQFMLDRAETQLLSAVDQRASEELAGRFEFSAATGDPSIQVIQRVGHAVIQSTELLVHKQVEIWQQTIAAAHDQWQRASRQTTEQMQAALAGALSQSLSQHAAQLAKSEQASAEQLHLRWEQWQTALSHNARLLHAQQQEMVKQGELMTQAIRAAGDVVQLERALNDNLGALAGAKNFEDTVMSLAAAIHLLNTRLGGHAEPPTIELRRGQVKGRAA